MVSRRGSFLIGVLLVAVVVAMFAAAALALAPAGLQRSQHQARRQAAERAIQSGTEYAIARIRATPGGRWRAADAYQFQTPGMLVQERDGQVVGWIQEGEAWARFRYTFNALDGPGGSDGLDNPSQPMANPPLHSANNLPNNFEVPSPLGSPLPPHCLLLSVEATCGSATLDGNGLPSGFSGNPSGVKSQQILELSSEELQGYDSVASATGNLDFTVQAGQSVHFNALGSGMARMRTKGGLEVRQADHRQGCFRRTWVNCARPTGACRSAQPRWPRRSVGNKKMPTTLSTASPSVRLRFLVRAPCKCRPGSTR